MSLDYYDSLETREPEAREADLFAALCDHLRAPRCARRPSRACSTGSTRTR